MKTFDDKVAVITGAGSGIGRALALNLAGRGALLAISDVDDAGLAETVDLVKAAGAREVRSDHLDVSDRAAFTAYAAAVAEQFGRVNLVVNNAGVALAGDLEDLESSAWCRCLGRACTTRRSTPCAASPRRCARRCWSRATRSA
jgi:NAD(P)-dependent dehydrogenase (short-subunit alcohol dehydrogenase family)